MNIIIMGKQGSGKGTQAKLIAEHYGLKHLSTGDLYRQKVAEKDELAMKMKEFSDKGELVPDELVIELVKENLGEEGTLFDGFPRTLEQAEKLDELIDIDMVIELQISDEEVKERMLKRGRVDDTEESINRRLDIYHEKTEPLIEYYRPRDIVREVDGTGSVEEIFERIKKVIDAEKAGE